MAQRTTADETISREELASYFRRLSEEFGEGGNEINVEVGNKTVSLNPPKDVDLSVDVVERSTMFRGNRETIQLELNWKASTTGSAGGSPDDTGSAGESPDDTGSAGGSPDGD